MEYERINDKILGKGGYSTVYLCKKKNSDSDKRYAMKISEENKIPSKNHLLLEYKILKHLNIFLWKRKQWFKYILSCSRIIRK